MSFLFPSSLLDLASRLVLDVLLSLPAPIVDIWSGDDDFPIITHGRTLTTKISARDAIQAIAKYAFLASPYPIILSLEIHCGIAQQDKLVDELIEAFGDRLVMDRIDRGEGLEILTLPSPEDLKGKVLLKVCVFALPSAYKPLDAMMSDVYFLRMCAGEGCIDCDDDLV